MHEELPQDSGQDILVLLAYFISQALIMTLFAAVGGAGAEGDIQSAMSGFLAQKASLISLLHNLLVIAVILAFYFKNRVSGI